MSNKKGKEAVITKEDEKLPRIEIRATPKELVKAIEKMDKGQRNKVREMGFGSLLNLKIQEIPHKLGYWLVDNFCACSGNLKLQNGTEIHIKASDVETTLGFGRGEIKIESRKKTGDCKLLREWRALFGKKDHTIKPSEVSKKMIECVQGEGWFKIHFVVLMVTLLIESLGNVYANQRIIKYLEDIDNIQRIDWCDFVVKSLVLSKQQWEQNKQSMFKGPLLFLMVLSTSLTFFLGKF